MKIPRFLKCFYLTTILTLIFISACKDDPLTPADDFTTVDISCTTDTAYVNQKIIFKSVVTQSNPEVAYKILWTSADTTIAEIDSAGICLLKSEGTTTIAAAVLSAENKILAKDSIQISSELFSFKIYTTDEIPEVGGKYYLFYHKINQNVTWKSDNETVAIIDSEERVNILAFGRASIIGSVTDSSGTVLDSDTIEFIAEWQKVFPLQYNINSFDYNPVNGAMFITVYGPISVFGSYDSGNTWLPRNNGVKPEDDFYTITGCLNSPNTIMCSEWGPESEVIRSEDGGLTWKYFPDLKAIFSIAIDPNNDKVVYALQGRPNWAVFKTTDGGGKWSMISNYTPEGKIIIDQSNPQIMYLGMHQSTNGGRGWKPLNIEGKGRSTNIIYVDQAGRIYAKDYNWDDTYHTRILRSSDLGITWKVFGEAGPGYITTAHNNPDIFLNAAGIILYSMDDGQSWRNIPKPINLSPSVKGAAILNTDPFEFIYVLDRDIWKYKQYKR